jgi:hypothetical protein
MASTSVSQRGNDTEGQHDTVGGPVGLPGSCTSQLDLIAVTRLSEKTGYFAQYFVTGEDDKAVFVFLTIQGRVSFLISELSFSV